MASDGSGSLEAYGSPLAPRYEVTGSCDIFPDLEHFVDDLLERIRPQAFSIWTRDIVVEYAKRVIGNCFAAVGVNVRCFLFGSVPLKTYLPDGDIDIGIIQISGGSLNDRWIKLVKAAFEAQIGGGFVRSVEVVQAEVKLVKCVINNIVVDISFNSFNGLCTLVFLEEVDVRIGRSHLFKRSVILIKGWCCYDSRLLGAQHSLLSTYALETLILAVFNMYGEDLQTPLQVFKAFMMVFSTFDFSKYCVSIHGMIPLKSFPAKGVEPFPEATGPLFLGQLFRSEELLNYSPQGVVGWDKPNHFKQKEGTMHIMDPLLDDNNLGKSTSVMSTQRFCGTVKRTHERLSQALDHGSDTTSAVKVLKGIFAGSIRACVTLPPLFVGTCSVSGKSIMVYPLSEEDADIRSPHDHVTSQSYLEPRAGSDASVSNGRPGESRVADSPEADGQSAGRSTASSSVDPDLNYLEGRSAMRENGREDERAATPADPGPGGRGFTGGTWSQQGHSRFDGRPPTPGFESGRYYPGGGEVSAAFIPGGREVVGPVSPAGAPPDPYVYEQDGMQLYQPPADMYYRRGPGATGQPPLHYLGWYQPYPGRDMYQHPLGHGGMLPVPSPPPHIFTGHPGTANGSTYGVQQHPMPLSPPALVKVHARKLGSLEPYRGSEDILAGDREGLHSELTEVKRLLSSVMLGGPYTPSTSRSREASGSSGATTPPTTPQSLSPQTTSERVHMADFPSSGRVASLGDLSQAPVPNPGSPPRGGAMDSLPGGGGEGHDGPWRTVRQNKANRAGANRAPRGITPPTMPLGRPVRSELDNFPALRDTTAGRTEFVVQAQPSLRGPGAPPSMASPMPPRPPLQNPAPPPAIPYPWTPGQSSKHGASSEHQAGMGQQPRRPHVPGPSQSERQEGVQSGRNGPDPPAARAPQTWPSMGKAQSDRGETRSSTGRITTAPRPAETLDLGSERAASSHRPSAKGASLLGSPERGPMGRLEVRNTQLGAEGSAGAEAALQTRQSTQLYDTEFPSLSSTVEKKRGREKSPAKPHHSGVPP